MSMPVAIGVDFGTTNTVVAIGDGSDHARLISFETPSAPTATFRSALSFNYDSADASGRAVNAGPWAIKAYLDDPGETRFIFAESDTTYFLKVVDARVTFIKDAPDASSARRMSKAAARSTPRDSTTPTSRSINQRRRYSR